jgi:Domain of unknown function (DUF4365)
MAGNYATERKGIAAVQARVAELEQIWRETSTGDFGIDGHIEFIDENSEPTGLMVGVQVKSGPSYFLGETALTVSYTSNEKHQKYWELYPVPVILILHHPERKDTYWVDARQEFRTGKVAGGKIVISKQNNFMASTVSDIFKNAGLTQTEYIREIPALLEHMLATRTRNAGFDISFFELFCLGMTNICRSLFFGMDLALKIAEYKLAAADSEFGVGLGHSEYDFLEDYIRFLVSQNLVHANYSDLLIDLEHRDMIPKFIVPLSRRGRALQDLISKQEDELVNAGILQPNRYRAAQESFVEMVFMALNTRFGRVAEVATALQTGEPSEPTKADGVMDVLKRLLSR